MRLVYVWMIGLTALLGGCGSGTFLSAATTTGILVAQERSLGNAVDDSAVFLEIKHLYLQHDVNDLLAGVNVEVIEGRVYLTGSVKARQTRIDAVRLAWQPKGTKAVVNEIQISQARKVKNIAVDQWIRAHLRSRLLFEKKVHSLNYSIEVVEGIVYLMGIAQDHNELDKVLYIARRIKGVNKVVSHIRLKDFAEPVSSDVS